MTERSDSTAPSAALHVEALLRDTLSPGAFFVAAPGSLRIEEAPGERRIFLDLPERACDHPLVQVRLDRPTQRIEVIRNVRLRPVGGVSVLTESVGTVPLHLAEQLPRCVERALTGISRLPITSVETPLPEFVFGMIAYLPDGRGSVPVVDPLALLPHLLDGGRSIDDRARLLEVVLRSIDAQHAQHLAAALHAAPAAALFKTMFHHLALSPYTALVDRLVAVLLELDRETAAEVMSYLLRHLVRHLNAFDLVRFHNRGANFPDALMLDAVLRAYVSVISDSPDRPLERLRSRALCQAWLARKNCEGLAVPDAPTSPGENARQTPHPPVPQEQITDPQARRRRLFCDAPADEMLSPTARRRLEAALHELDDPAELRELGTAVFLDRPLGLAKRDGEEDRTPLLSYEAFSVRVARARLKQLRPDANVPWPSPVGFAVSRLPGHARQGVVSLEDAKKVALDFVFTRTTRSSLDALLRQYDWRSLNAADAQAYEWLIHGHVLLIRTGREISAFDERMRPRFVLRLTGRDDPVRYIECGGVEFVEGLHVIADGNELPIPPTWNS